MMNRCFLLFLLPWAVLAPTPVNATPASSAESPESPSKAADTIGNPAKSQKTSAAKAGSSEGDVISLEEWDKNDWELVKPTSSLVELDGYFRFRTDMLRKLDFNNGAVWEQKKRYEAFSGSGDDRKADFTGANMRLRLEPTIHVTDGLHIVTTIDVLDNLVLGSTPNSAMTTLATPVALTNQGQQTPKAGVNAVRDSIVVKRAYARITALNEQLELRVGRMPNHWGLGMMANSGDCLDCNYDETVDRLSLSFKMSGLLLSPMYDWVSGGRVVEPFGRGVGQPLDAATWDDVDQFSLRIAKVDHPNDIEDQLLNDNTVFNFGAWVSYRRQSRDFKAGAYQRAGDNTKSTDPALPIVDSNAVDDPDERRDGRLFTVDAFGRLFYGQFELNAEAAMLVGSFKDRLVPEFDDDGKEVIPSNGDVGETKTNILQIGATLELKYRLSNEYKGGVFSLMSGFASGDSAPGFGALDGADTQRSIAGTNNTGAKDNKLYNFQFSPNYHIDLLMFRQIIGTVTNAAFIRPQFSYMFDERLGGRLAVVYGAALMKRATASCYDPSFERCRTPGDPDKDTGSRHMGVEIDAELAYGLLESKSKSPLRASIAGGILFPMGAFKNPVLDEGDRGGSFAWTLQTRLYLTF